MEKQPTPEAVAALSDAMAATYPAEMYNYYFGGENENPAQLTFCAVDAVANALERLTMIPTANAAAAITEMLAAYVAHAPQADRAKTICAAINVQKIIHNLTANANEFNLLLGVLNRVEFSERHNRQSAEAATAPL